MCIPKVEGPQQEGVANYCDFEGTAQNSNQFEAEISMHGDLNSASKQGVEKEDTDEQTL